MIQHTTMAIAFSEAKTSPINYPVELATKVVYALDRYAKARKAGKDWTAKLSYKTARYLASKGVPLQ